MIHLNLPSGATADIRDVADVTERQRRPIKRIQSRLAANADFSAAVKAAEDAKGVDGELSAADQSAIAAGMGSAFDDLEDLNDLLVAAFVAGWSYDFAVSSDACQDIKSADLDALREHVTPLAKALMPNFETSVADDSPTEPSTD